MKFEFRALGRAMRFSFRQPLALSVSHGAPSLDDLRGYSAAWNARLDRQQRSATLRQRVQAWKQRIGTPAAGAR